MRRTALLILIAAILLAASMTPAMAAATRGRPLASWLTVSPTGINGAAFMPRDHLGSVVARNHSFRRSVTATDASSVDCFYLIGGRYMVDPNDPTNSDLAPIDPATSKPAVTGRFERYNHNGTSTVAHNTFEALPDMPHPRMNAAATSQWFTYWRHDTTSTDPTKLMKDETQLIFVFGGTDGQGNPVKEVDVFNTQTQTWNDTATPVLSVNDPANPASGYPYFLDTTVTPAVWKVAPQYIDPATGKTVANAAQLPVGLDETAIQDTGRRSVATDIPVSMDAPMISEFSENQSSNNTGYISSMSGANPTGPNPDPYLSPRRFHIISTSPTPVYYLYNWIDDTYRLISDTTDPDVIPTGTMVRPGPLPADIPVLKGACGTRAFDAYGGRGGWYNYIFGGLQTNGTASAIAWRGSMRHKNEGWTPLSNMPQPVYWAAQMQNYARPWLFDDDQSDMPVVVGGNTAPGVYSKKVLGYIGGPYRQWFQTSSDPTQIFPFSVDMPEARGERPAAGVLAIKPYNKSAWWPAIFVFGGQSAPGTFASTIYKIEINDSRYVMPSLRSDRILKKWQRIADMPTPRQVAPSAMVDGKIYVMGGIAQASPTNPTGQTVVNTVECYDTATNTWSTRAPMIWPVKDAQAVAVGRKIYVMGGKMSDTVNFPITPNNYDTTNPPATPINPAVSNNIMQIYDVDTNTWTASVMKNPDGTMILNSDGTPWINPDCPTLLSNAVSSAVCATSDGLIHVMGGTLDGGNYNLTWKDPWSRTHQVYDPVAKKWYRNVRNPLDGPFMCPELGYGHQNQGAEVICDYDTSGRKTHEWIYLVAGRIGGGQQGDIYRLDWMACKNWTTPMPMIWDLNNDLSALWDDQGTFTNPKGWPEWQRMIPVNKTGIAAGDGEQYKGFGGAKNQAGHAVITDRYGVKRVMVFGGWDNDVDDQTGGTAGKDEFYPVWRGTNAAKGDGIWALAYHSPEEPLPVSDCTTYECTLPMGKSGRPAVFQLGNTVYLVGGSTRGFYIDATGATKTGNFPQPYCFKAIVNDGSPEIWNATTIADLFNCPYDYTNNQLSEPKVVTRVTADGKYFWIEEDDRSLALKIGPVDPSVVTVTAGDKVKLTGAVTADAVTKEPIFTPSVVTIDSSGAAIPKPIGLGTRAFIGGKSTYKPGRTGGSGANNLGMLARLYGQVTYVSMASDSIGLYFYIDDGSGLTDGTADISTGIANKGIRVYHGGWSGMDLVPGKSASVGGIVTFIKTDDGKIIPALISDELISTDSAGFVKIY